MRTLALFGVTAIAFSLAATNAVWAWSTEPAAPQQSDNNSNVASPLFSDEKLKELQDKVQSGNGSQSGFYISGSVDQPASGYSGIQTNPLGSAPSMFNYSPNPGFRGRGD